MEEGVDTPVGAVATQEVDLVDAVGDYPVYDLVGVEAAPRAAQRRPAQHMDDPHLINGQELPLVLIEPLIAIVHAPHLGRPIVNGEAEEYLPYDHIQPRTEPPARHNRRPNFLGFEEQVLPRPSRQPVLLLLQVIGFGEGRRPHHIRPLIGEEVVGEHTRPAIFVAGGVADGDGVHDQVDVDQLELVDEVGDCLDYAHRAAEVPHLFEKGVLGVQHLDGDAVEVLVVAWN